MIDIKSEHSVENYGKVDCLSYALGQDEGALDAIENWYRWAQKRYEKTESLMEMIRPVGFILGLTPECVENEDDI